MKKSVKDIMRNFNAFEALEEKEALAVNGGGYYGNRYSGGYSRGYCSNYGGNSYGGGGAGNVVAIYSLYIGDSSYACESYGETEAVNYPAADYPAESLNCDYSTNSGVGIVPYYGLYVGGGGWKY